MNLLVGYCSYWFNLLHLYGLIGAVSVPSLFKLELLESFSLNLLYDLRHSSGLL